MSIISVAGDRNITLYMIKGLDYIGQGYDAIRTVMHTHHFAVAKKLSAEGKKGLHLVYGDPTNPTFSWPVWAEIA